MPALIDPYYKWLGIPPAEQPPNLYRLIGVTPLEDNEDVLCNAADQRMVYIRTFQLGENSAVSQKLLNEIAAAKALLLDPDNKKVYDDVLRAKLFPLSQAPSVSPRITSPSITSSSSSQQLPRHSAATAVDLRLVAAGIAAGLVVVLLLLAALPATNLLGLYSPRPDSSTKEPGAATTPATPSTTDVTSPPKIVPPVSVPVTPPKVKPPLPVVTPTPSTTPAAVPVEVSIDVFAEPVIPLSPAEKNWRKVQGRPKGAAALAAELPTAAKQALAEGHFELLQEIVRAVPPAGALGRKQRLEFLQGLQSQATEFVAQRALSDAATVELSQALEAADAPAARDAAVIALRMARLANAPAQLRETALLASQVRYLEVIQREGPAAMQQLAAGETSPLALRMAGEYACFLQGDFERGLEWLKQCPESPWGDLPKMDMAGLDVEDQRNLGQRWWEQAAQSPLCYRNQIRARAAHWLRQSLSQTTLLALMMEPENIVREKETTLLQAAWPSGHRCELKGGRALVGQTGQGLFLNLGEYVTTFVPQAQVQSISAWMRIPRYEGTGDIFSGGNLSHGLSFTLKEGRAARFVIGEGNGLETGQFFSTGLVDNAWHHLVFVVNYTSHQLTYYLDGEQLARSPFTAKASFKDNILFLGGGNVGFQGAFDEVALFSHPLSAAEVQYLHDRGLNHESLPQTLGLPIAGP
ncbi:MAG: LamG domain-containing protein [Pirellulaceae bacterium]